jgi:hypothetical protein
MKAVRLLLLVELPLGSPALGWAQTPAPRAVRNLETFARLYGYVRYFHPRDEAAATDWNSLAELGAERAAAARTDDELQATLLALFRPLAPTLQLVPAGNAYAFKEESITPPSLAGYQPISWQHQGYGQGNPQSPYHSQRTHRPAPALTQAAMGPWLKVWSKSRIIS